MIRCLSAENLAIIDQAELDLDGGYTVLTGETGAGKSLLIDAIGLALGGRADSDLVRNGTRKASVSLQIDLRGQADVVRKCLEAGIEVDDSELVIQRDVSVEGRSTARINGRPVAIGVLRDIGQALVDLHGQHDHQSLLVPDRQIEFLDSWIGAEASERLADVASHYERVAELRRRLNALRTNAREREQRIDLLRYQVEEIAAADPKPNESDELQAALVRLQHAEKLMQGSQSALAALADDDGAAIERMALAIRELETCARLDPSMETVLEPLRETMVALRENLSALRAYAEEVEADPARLEEAASRIDALKRLFRKYGDDEAAVLEHRARAEAELALLEGSEANEEELAAALQGEESALAQSAEALTELRSAMALRFADLVQAEVRELAMERAVFQVSVERKPIEPNGADRVTFLFTANPGEPPRPLHKVASGGEISRVMLAIKVASSGRAGVPTLIFDEVDAGLSGRAAAVTAKKIEALARHRQVLVISHLPQIASRADRHWRIEKLVESGRAVVRIHALDDQERVVEIARMLAGEQVSEAALQNARDMLADRSGAQKAPLQVAEGGVGSLF